MPYYKLFGGQKSMPNEYDVKSIYTMSCMLSPQGGLLLAFCVVRPWNIIMSLNCMLRISSIDIFFRKRDRSSLVCTLCLPLLIFCLEIMSRSELLKITERLTQYFPHTVACHKFVQCVWHMCVINHNPSVILRLTLFLEHSCSCWISLDPLTLRLIFHKTYLNSPHLPSFLFM